MYETYVSSDVKYIIQYMNEKMIKKEDIISLYHDGKHHILIYNSERNHY